MSQNDAVFATLKHIVAQSMLDHNNWAYRRLKSDLNLTQEQLARIDNQLMRQLRVNSGFLEIAKQEYVRWRNLYSTKPYDPKAYDFTLRELAIALEDFGGVKLTL